MFQQNKSNDSSIGNKSFYDIFNDSPSLKKKENDINLSESQKEFFKALREEKRALVKSFMEGKAQDLNGFIDR